MHAGAHAPACTQTQLVCELKGEFVPRVFSGIKAETEPASSMVSAVDFTVIQLNELNKSPSWTSRSLVSLFLAVRNANLSFCS